MASEKDHPSLVQADVETQSPPPALHRSNDDASKDVAIAVVGEHPHEVDPAIARRAVRKIDWFLMPAMMLGCRRL